MCDRRRGAHGRPRGVLGRCGQQPGSEPGRDSRPRRHLGHSGRGHLHLLPARAPLRQGVDERTATVLSRGAFGADVVMAKSSVGEAEQWWAAAVGARDAVFVTCGSSISIHTALLTITGPGQKVLVDRNVHKSVVASLILAGALPVWLRPSWDHERQSPPGDRRDCGRVPRRRPRHRRRRAHHPDLVRHARGRREGWPGPRDLVDRDAYLSARVRARSRTSATRAP